LKAHDTKIFIYLEGSKSFQVPLFQRTYSWKRRHIKTLWRDLEEAKEEVGTTHFFGSFVTMPIPSPAASISKYVIIDGQQRLVTISILLAALRRKIIELDKDSKIADSIYDQYLVKRARANLTFYCVSLLNLLIFPLLASFC